MLFLTSEFSSLGTKIPLHPTQQPTHPSLLSSLCLPVFSSSEQVDSFLWCQPLSSLHPRSIFCLSSFLPASLLSVSYFTSRPSLCSNTSLLLGFSPHPLSLPLLASPTLLLPNPSAEKYFSVWHPPTLLLSLTHTETAHSLNIYIYILRLHYVACGVLFPGPGIEPKTPALGAWSLKHWTTREVPLWISLISLMLHFDLPSQTFCPHLSCWAPLYSPGLSLPPHPSFLHSDL